MKPNQIKVVEIFDGYSNTQILDNCEQSWEYIKYLYNTKRRIQINLINI